MKKYSMLERVKTLQTTANLLPNLSLIAFSLVVAVTIVPSVFLTNLSL